MSVRRVFLAGEGRHELGGLEADPPYCSGEPIGVLQALLERCAGAPAAVEIVGARRWKDIHKFRAGGHAAAATRAVLGLHDDGVEHQCDVLAFVRDTDGDTRRATEIDRGLAMAREMFPTVDAIGGVAVQSLDGWGLALAGRRHTQELKPKAAKETLDANGTGSTEARANAAREADLDRLPVDAASLIAFIARARAVLAP